MWKLKAEHLSNLCHHEITTKGCRCNFSLLTYSNRLLLSVYGCVVWVSPLLFLMPLYKKVWHAEIVSWLRHRYQHPLTRLSVWLFPKLHKRKMQLDIGVSPPAHIIKINHHLVPNIYTVRLCMYASGDRNFGTVLVTSRQTKRDSVWVWHMYNFVANGSWPFLRQTEGGFVNIVTCQAHPALVHWKQISAIMLNQGWSSLIKSAQSLGQRQV